jgi:hypothetical protein
MVNVLEELAASIFWVEVKMEAASSSEMLVTNPNIAQCYIRISLAKHSLL